MIIGSMRPEAISRRRTLCRTTGIAGIRVMIRVTPRTEAMIRVRGMIRIILRIILRMGTMTKARGMRRIILRTETTIRIRAMFRRITMTGYPEIPRSMNPCSNRRRRPLHSQSRMISIFM